MKRILPLIALLCALLGLSNAQNVPLALVSGSITAQATTCQPQAGSAACVFLQLNSQIAQATITVGPSTFVGTLQFEASPDGGTTWIALNGNPQPSGAAVTSTTANGVWQVNVGGYSFIRVRCSAFTSGVATVTLNPSSAAAASTGSGSGTVSPNNNFTGALCVYAAAGGSTVCGPSADVADSGTGNLTIGGVGLGTGTVTICGTTSGCINFNCAATCTTFQSASPWQFTANSGMATKHFNQVAANNFGGSCTMVSGTCNVTINLTYSTPLCFASRVSGTVTGILTASLATTTLTLSSSVGTDTGVVAGFCMGNPT